MSLKNYTQKRAKHGVLSGCQIQKSPVKQCSHVTNALLDSTPKNYTQKRAEHGVLSGCQIRKSRLERCSDASVTTNVLLGFHTERKSHCLGQTRAMSLRGTCVCHSVFPGPHSRSWRPFLTDLYWQWKTLVLILGVQGLSIRFRVQGLGFRV